MKNLYSAAIIGGGAAGIVAAISAKRKGASVVICEKMPRLGKKILASGNGRCNLLNDALDETRYNNAARHLVKSVFLKFGRNEILSFFKELGLEVYSDLGRIFPVTNQAASVLKVLEMELERLLIPVKLNFEVTGISESKGDFVIKSKSGEEVESKSVIIAGGGRSYPALGSDGSAYRLAERFGHSILEPVPAAVPIVVKDPLCHILQGQKISANAKAIVDEKTAARASGELLFTKYGLSGTAILDISEEISVAINRDKKKNVFVILDTVPFMDEDALKDELSKRRRKALAPENILTGILPGKLCIAFKDAPDLKERRFKVSCTRGWNEAEFTAGGVNVKEIDDKTLESKLKKGLYFAGEVLDVNGKRGGYNLAWAWASGFIAGAYAAV